ncbi:copper-metallothionein-like [Daphnia pulicaria]|uniref:copper-metallothionein-like n=1 Tax=Daphnia pulicaria TaxID=35523 RepID=UPI001EEA67BB|nr:copper-metallothionein-like [Daphnia pulicaria]
MFYSFIRYPSVELTTTRPAMPKECVRCQSGCTCGDDCKCAANCIKCPTASSQGETCKCSTPGGCTCGTNCQCGASCVCKASSCCK